MLRGLLEDDSTRPMQLGVGDREAYGGQVGKDPHMQM